MEICSLFFIADGRGFHRRDAYLIKLVKHLSPPDTRSVLVLAPSVTIIF